MPTAPTAVEAPVTPERIHQFAFAYAVPLILESAIRHHVFDTLDHGPKSLHQIHLDTGASERGLAAILNALVGFEFLSKDAQEIYSLTAESAAFLVSHKPGYHGPLFEHISGQLMPQWMTLDQVVRTGKPAQRVNSEQAGTDFFLQFVEAIFPLSYPGARNLGNHLGLAKTKKPVRVLDLAAGSGVWGIALAEQSPLVSVTAVDWEPVLAVTQKVARQHGVAERLTTVGGDLLKVPFGQDYQVATLGHILHSEGGERSQKLIQKTFAALAPGGTIAVMEFLVNAKRTGPPMGLLFAVNMLVNTEAGDTFSFEEISEWLREAGFVKPRLLPGPGPSPLVLATKPK